MSSRFTAAFACTILLGAAPSAHAQDYRGMYMGGELGTFDFEEQVQGGISDNTTVYQLFGGYRFNDHVALELGLGQTGDIEDEAIVVLPPFGDVTLEFDSSYDIYTLRAIGILPFDLTSLFAAAGYFSASLGGTVTLAGFGEIGFVDGHDRGATASIGVQRDFRLDLENLSIRAEYKWLDIDDVDASSFLIGMIYRF